MMIDIFIPELPKGNPQYLLRKPIPPNLGQHLDNLLIIKLLFTLKYFLNSFIKD